MPAANTAVWSRIHDQALLRHTRNGEGSESSKILLEAEFPILSGKVESDWLKERLGVLTARQKKDEEGESDERRNLLDNGRERGRGCFSLGMLGCRTS